MLCNIIIVFFFLFNDTESTCRYFLNKKRDEEIPLYTYTVINKYISRYYIIRLLVTILFLFRQTCRHFLPCFSTFQAHTRAQVQQSFYDPRGKYEWWWTVVTRQQCMFEKRRVRVVSLFPFPATAVASTRIRRVACWLLP